MGIVKLLLLAEGLVLTMRYVKAHTYENIYEREYLWDAGAMTGEERWKEPDRKSEEDQNGEIYGIGYEPEEGMFFWFHKQNEMDSSAGWQP